MKKLNKNDYIVLENILLSNTMSKTELSKILNISIPGVFKIIKKLKEKNLVSDESELLTPKGGRPRETLKINKDYKKILGLFLNKNYIISSVAYLNGEIIEKRIRKRNNALVQTKFIKLIVDEIEYFIDKYGKDNIAGIGISIPGLIDDNKGLVKYSPLFKGQNLKISEYIEDTFNIPCTIDNDVRSVLKAEKIMGNLKNISNAFLVCINNDLDSSLLINDTIYSGVNFSAGQIKNILVNGKKLGEYCCFKSILNRINQKNKKDLENIDMQYIIEQANKNNKLYVDIMLDLAKNISLAISNICHILDIENILLSGSYINNNDIFVNAIIDNIKENTINNMNIFCSKLDDQEALASISIVIDNLFSKKKFII